MNNNVKKGMYHIHDKSYKDLYSKKEVAVDLFRNFLNKQFAKNLKADDLTLVNKSFITSDYEEKESDIVYSAKIGESEAFLYILLEFQSTIDYTMPIRLFLYMSEIIRDYCKNANHDKNDKYIKIPPVIPIVLYNGDQKWDVPAEFRNIFYNEEFLETGILNFKYDILDIKNDFTKEELLNYKNVTSAIFLLDQKLTPLEFIDRIKAIALFFDSLSEEELKAIKHWIQNTVQDRLREDAIKILDADKREVESMVASNAFIWRDSIEKAKEQAERNKQIEIAKNLLDILDDETIASKTNLDIGVVKKLREESI